MDVNFDRKAFVPVTRSTPSSLGRAFGSLILLIVLVGMGFLGYRFLSDAKPGAAPATSDSQSLEAVQQQVARLEKRLEQLERHRKMSSPEPDPPSATGGAQVTADRTSPKKTTYTVAPPRGTKAPSALASVNQTAATPEPSASASDWAATAAVADREAWQATTDRLADVVGVVGSQEGELSKTRDQVNALLAETRRSAIPFELHRGAARQSVGPVSMLLKTSDVKNQRYTVCVYLEDKCIELRDRTVHEVVVFVPSRNAAPLELVATRVLRDRIVGYLEIPVGKATP